MTVFPSAPKGPPMASSLSGSGTCSGSEGDLQHLMDQRKRKRMLSNRESARRSRMRKQKLVDDLTAQVTVLQQENAQILSNLKAMAQVTAAVETENSILRAQITELSSRLQSLDEILRCVNVSSGDGFACEVAALAMDGFLANPWGPCSANSQPILASPDLFQYW